MQRRGVRDRLLRRRHVRASRPSGGRGGAILRWVLIIGGSLVGLVVVLAFVGWLMHASGKRARDAVRAGTVPPGHAERAAAGVSSRPLAEPCHRKRACSRTAGRFRGCS